MKSVQSLGCMCLLSSAANVLGFGTKEHANSLEEELDTKPMTRKRSLKLAAEIAKQILQAKDSCRYLLEAFECLH